jgi:hypothetical protein
MGSISVEGLSEQQLADLKKEASRQGISINRLALNRLTNQKDVPNAADTKALAALAASWTQEEADAFTAAIAPLEQVDPELWV